VCLTPRVVRFARSLAARADPCAATLLGDRRVTKFALLVSMPRPEQFGGLYAYCLTTPCHRIFQDLAHALDDRALHLLAALLSITTAALLTVVAMRAPFSRSMRAFMCVTSICCSLIIADALPAAVDRRRVIEPVAPWLQLHSCFDYARCANGFSVYVEGHNRSTLAHARATSPVPKVWMPPSEIPIATSQSEACITVSFNELGDHTLQQLAASSCQGRNACGLAQRARNHVVVDMSDVGISWDSRMRKLGCAMIAQTHSELTNHIHGFDIALPLGLVPGRNGAPDAHALERISPWPKLSHAPSSAEPMPRKYWLTFQGTVNYGGAYERRALLMPLAKQSTASRPVLIAVKCRKGDDGTYAESADISPAQCAELDRAPREKYLSTLNTTFALVPGGMQPASFRLDEVCAAGAIPVFVSGDLVTRSVYVRPFDEMIKWHDISLHFAWEESHRIVDTLAKISPSEIARMQRAVHEAWRRHLRPPEAHRRTLYTILKQRASFQSRRV